MKKEDILKVVESCFNSEISTEISMYYYSGIPEAIIVGKENFFECLSIELDKLANESNLPE